MRGAYGLPQFFLVGFKLRGLGGLFPAGKRSSVPCPGLCLPFPLRPILTLGNAVFAAMQKVDLIEIFPVAQLHDFGFEVFHRRVCAAVLAPGAGVCRSVHVGQERNFRYPQRIDNDMHMDIAAVVVSVRVGADNGLVSGKLLPAQIPRPTPAPGLRSNRCPSASRGSKEMI